MEEIFTNDTRAGWIRVSGLTDLNLGSMSGLTDLNLGSISELLADVRQITLSV